MKGILFSLILACSFCSLNAQSAGTDIQYINLRDSSLVRNITNVIEREKKDGNGYGFFSKGLGYIAIHISDYNHRDTVLKYHITPMLISIRREDPDIAYPLYYTTIDGHPVLIFVKSVTLIADLKYSNTSKDNLRQVIEPFLPKAKNADFFNDKGEKVFTDKNFRPDYFKFGSDKDYYLIRRSY